MKSLVLLLLTASLAFGLTCPCGSTELIKMAIADDAPYPPQDATYYVCANCGARCVDGYWCTAEDYLKKYEKELEKGMKYKYGKD